jgi:invasion protein IalB
MTLRAAMLISLLLATPVLVPMAAEADSKAIGRYNDWRVYTEGEGRNLVCFATVEANDKAPKAATHGEVVFYVAVWKSGASRGQVSLRVGYDLRTDIAPTAIVGRDRFAMVASGQEAFLKDDRDNALIAALQKGQELRVEAASVKDARTAYHFSLKGSRDAIDKARALCK